MSTAALFTIDPTTHASTQKMGNVSARPWVRLVSLLLVDLGALILASFLMTAILGASVAPFLPFPEIARLTISVALLCAIGLYSTKVMHPAIELQKVICAVALATIVLTTMQKHSSDTDAQAAIPMGFLLQTACLTLSRVLLRAAMIRLGFWLTPTVIVGSGPLAQSLVHILEKHKHIGLKPVAVLADPVPPTDLYGGRLLVDHLDNAARIKHQHRI